MERLAFALVVVAGCTGAVRTSPPLEHPTVTTDARPFSKEVARILALARKAADPAYSASDPRLFHIHDLSVCDAIAPGLHRWKTVSPEEPPGFTSCTVRSKAGGHAVQILAEPFCAGDGCPPPKSAVVTEKVAMTRTRDGAELEVLPSLDWIVIDRVEPLAAGGSDVFLERVDLVTQAKQRFASCFAPVLSPKERYVVCRDQQRRVLRVAVEGGALETLWDESTSVPTLALQPGEYIVAAPVVFPTTTKLVVPGEAELAWSE